MYKKILVPVDVSVLERGEKTLLLASALVEAGGDIVLLGVVEGLPSYLSIDVPVQLIEAGIREVKEKLTALQAKTAVSARIEVRCGAPATEILAAAKEHGADLIVIASHTPDFTNYFLGATADRVVRHATCSVLVDR